MNKDQAIATFPDSYQDGIKEFLAVIASTKHDRTWYEVPAPQRDAAIATAHEAEKKLINLCGNDRRVVGLSAQGDIVFVLDLIRQALQQLAYEAMGHRRWDLVAQRAHEAFDAQQCADDLGIQAVDSTEQALAELERVGLGGLVDASDLAKPGGPLWRLP